MFLSTLTDSSFLVMFRDFWIALCTQMQTYRDVFLYLERTYLQKEDNRTFWELTMELVKSKLSNGVRERLVAGTLDLIHQDRINDRTDQKDLIAKMIHVMLALNFYKQFESGFFSQTRDFFKQNAKENFILQNVSEAHA